MFEFRFERSYHGPINAVIFDWAGTTVDYGCMAPTQVFLEVFRRHGVEITTEQARGPMGSHKRDHIREISRMAVVANRWQEVHGQPCSEADVDEMYTEFIPLQVAAISEYSDLIPGTLETVEACRRRGIKVAGTTGYSREMMEVLEKEAQQRGYVPDTSVSATDVPVGRPAPWMCFTAAQRLGVYPMESIVKIGDTVPDIAAGLNAGMWTVGVTKTGNEFGLDESAVEALSDQEFEERQSCAYQKMYQAGAHYVVDEIADVLECLEDIEERLEAGERP